MTENSKPLDPNWRRREIDRFNDGTYQAGLPWNSAQWWRDSPLWQWWRYEQDARTENLECQFPHVGIGDQMKIAFTENDAKGQRDIQTAMKPGKYLTRFFKDVLSENEIRHWAQKWAEQYSLVNATITGDTDEIEQVYVRGPESCMSEAAGDYVAGIHPVRVYGGDSDIKLAYLGTLDNPTARCVCWPDKKVYGRIYGDEHRLRGALERLGWLKGHDEFRGAKLNFIPADDGYAVMPFLDFPNGVAERTANDTDKRYWIITQRGETADYHANQTCGTIREASENTWCCDRCGDRQDEQADGHSVDGDTWCEYCYENYAQSCEDCGAGYTSDAFYTAYQQRGPTFNGIYFYRELTVCEGCLENYTHCEHSNGEYHNAAAECTDGEFISVRDVGELHACSEDNRIVTSGDPCDCDHCENEREEAEENPPTTEALEAEGQQPLPLALYGAMSGEPEPAPTRAPIRVGDWYWCHDTHTWVLAA